MSKRITDFRDGFGGNSTLIVHREQYQDGQLAIVVDEEVFDEDAEVTCREPYGVITINLAPYNVEAAAAQSDHNKAFVKAYGENEGWAERLAEVIGGKRLPVVVESGFVKVWLWDFSGVDWEEDH